METAPVVPITETEQIIPQQVTIDATVNKKITGCSLCEYLKEVVGIPTCTLLNQPISIVIDKYNCPINRWEL